MQSYQPSVFARDDTLFGVCEALGEDFGFNPLYLRVTLALLVLWNPVAVFSGYAAAGLIVALSRLLAPNARRAGGAVSVQAATEHKPLMGDNEEDSDILAVAA